MSTFLQVLAILAPYAIFFVALVALVSALVWLIDSTRPDCQKWWHEQGVEDYDKSHRNTL